jgi:hypothetical protein
MLPDPTTSDQPHHHHLSLALPTPTKAASSIILNHRDEWMMPIVAEQGGMRYDQPGMLFLFYPE